MQSEINWNEYPFILLNKRQLCDYELIHDHSFNPLTGFMTEQQYISCVNDMKLPDGNMWPMPIVLHITEKWITNNLLNKEKLGE